MKAILIAILLGALIHVALLAVVPQDPPQPDVGAFCAMNHKDPNLVCSCANPDEKGVACTQNPETNRPRFCQWKCGHANSCGCCVS